MSLVRQTPRENQPADKPSRDSSLLFDSYLREYHPIIMREAKPSVLRAHLLAFNYAHSETRCSDARKMVRKSPLNEHFWERDGRKMTVFFHMQYARARSFRDSFRVLHGVLRFRFFRPRPRPRAVAKNRSTDSTSYTLQAVARQIKTSERTGAKSITGLFGGTFPTTTTKLFVIARAR